ncbi:MULTISPECIES: Lsr2 family protein [unclassified Microbacterium]|uniref:histone-like nucleoid-structuring protein Lsr2 n=1 Tax=unclassified Microbacterium TaxID=2609290 RepID=UPI00365447A6
MARKVVHQLVDDLDGEVLEIGAGEAVTFSLDGTFYEIDLSEKNAAALRDALQPWIAAGRRVAGTGAGTSRRSGSTRWRGRSASGRDLTAIRAWAGANGRKVSDRGRVPESLLQAYDAAH